MAGTVHLALVFDGDACIGRCQCGPAGDLTRIESRALDELTATSPPDWRIACCYSAKGYRRHGVASPAIAGLLHHGALSTYEQLGLERDRLMGEHRWVVTTAVEPTTRR